MKAQHLQISHVPGIHATYMHNSGATKLIKSFALKSNFIGDELLYDSSVHTRIEGGGDQLK